MHGKLPTRDSVVEMNIDGVNCWVVYSHERLLGKDWERWKIELPGMVIASVIRNPGTYGYEAGLYETAFMENGQLKRIFSKEEDPRWYDDVLGYLTEEEVLELLVNAVRKLK